MILKCKRDIRSESLTANRLYPVIAYDVNLNDDTVSYKIMDDSRSLSQRQNDRFEIVSYSKVGYIVVDGDNRFTKYLYKDLTDKDFFVDYYLENEKSIIASEKLENALISILSNELDSNVILNYFKMFSYEDENSEILIKAFFIKANEDEIITLSTMLYDEITMLNNFLVEIIIKNLSRYKAREIESLFMELYINSSSCSKGVMEIVNNYLNI
jgi:hypothetical protein